EALQRHLHRAKELFINNEHEDALSEIALGLTVDPQNGELKLLERQVWDAQGTSEGDTNNGVAERARETEEAIRALISTAREFQEKNDFAMALDELAKAYVLDPTHKETRKAEIEIRQAELRFNKQEESSLKLIYPDHSTPRQMP
ncbi:MAG: hypothetical protein OEM41_04050, partial [Ignavibacteria bacterium]|nr:hypothetical protein [Ignavibacteria bacterium]